MDIRSELSQDSGADYARYPAPHTQTGGVHHARKCLDVITVGSIQIRATFGSHVSFGAELFGKKDHEELSAARLNFCCELEIWSEARNPVE